MPETGWDQVVCGSSGLLCGEPREDGGETVSAGISAGLRPAAWTLQLCSAVQTGRAEQSLCNVEFVLCVHTHTHIHTHTSSEGFTGQSPVTAM